jgi:hypothetical protein
MPYYQQFLELDVFLATIIYRRRQQFGLWYKLLFGVASDTLVMSSGAAVMAGGAMVLARDNVTVSDCGTASGSRQWPAELQKCSSRLRQRWRLWRWSSTESFFGKQTELASSPSYPPATVVRIVLKRLRSSWWWNPCVRTVGSCGDTKTIRRCGPRWRRTRRLFQSRRLLGSRPRPVVWKSQRVSTSAVSLARPVPATISTRRTARDTRRRCRFVSAFRSDSRTPAAHPAQRSVRRSRFPLHQVERSTAPLRVRRSTRLQRFMFYVIRSGSKRSPTTDRTRRPAES